MNIVTVCSIFLEKMLDIPKMNTLLSSYGSCQKMPVNFFEQILELMQMIIKHVKAHSPAFLHTDKSCDAAFFS